MRVRSDKQHVLLFILLVASVSVDMRVDALFEEVTETKSLLEQVALLCQGRGTLYRQLLECISAYINNDQ
jgi:hypothetical protein